MYLIKRLFLYAVAVILLMSPMGAYAADYAIVDALNVAPLIPTILDALMAVATGGYDFFVGKGNGIIYILIWGFLAISISLYLLKMYFPKVWVSFFGFSGGGEMFDKGVSGFTIAENLLQPSIRAIIAVTVLLQIKPVYLTEWLINPFLQFGALYTESITETLNNAGIAPDIECPPSVVQQGWISPESCEFLVQPVSDLSYANNQVIKRGFDFIKSGLRGMITLIPHGGENFMNLITGILLVSTFVSSNLFMALLIIQAIFNFGMSLVLYPFQVLAYVVKPSDKWFDIWPAFSGITKSLQKIIVTMIACAFILCVNIAIIKSLFQWNSSVFVTAAGGSASSNVPTMASSALGFGEHSILWLSSVLTLYLMFRIFDMTRERLNDYIGKGMDGLYNQVRGDVKTLTKDAKKYGSSLAKAIGWIKKKK